MGPSGRQAGCASDYEKRKGATLKRLQFWSTCELDAPVVERVRGLASAGEKGQRGERPMHCKVQQQTTLISSGGRASRRIEVEAKIVRWVVSRSKSRENRNGRVMSGKRAAKACLFVCSCTTESVSDFESKLKPILERIDRNEAELSQTMSRNENGE